MSQRSVESDSKKALAEAFDNVVKAQAEKRAKQLAAEQRARGRSTAVMWVGVVTLLVAGAYLWLERPIWLFPSSIPPESPVVREASLRITLANAARHVEYFRRKHGRWPSTLDETGTRMSGIVYELDGSEGYVLHGNNGATRLTLRSTDSLVPFVGNSFEVITRRSR